jgi:asparagine synthase (glutamine-hydrolysing)
MCGITGYVHSQHSHADNWSADQHRSILANMNRRIVHRGPDDDGEYHRDNVHMAMRRLSIVDLRSGHQPVYNEDRSLTIVFNGEIYNHLVLREQLIRLGHRFTTHSDTETVLHLYEQHGYACVNLLVGMFAFAIHDTRRHVIFCARDRMGEKPLHYFYKKGLFAFGSEIKSILALPGVDKQLCLDALNEYLTYEYIPPPRTIYKDIYKIPAAHYLIFEKGVIALHRYWNVSLMDTESISLAEAERRVTELLQQSVESQMRHTDVPLGTFLSGGIDSSLVTAMMARAKDRIQTFTIAFDEESFDESQYARRVARYLNTDHHEEKLSVRQACELLPKVVSLLDEPFADPSILPTYLLADYARQHVKVALCGDGSDELFAGYPTYLAHRYAKFIPTSLHPFLDFATRWLPAHDTNISWDFKIKKFVDGLPFHGAIRHQVWLGAFPPRQRRLVLRPDIFERMMGSEWSILQDEMGQVSNGLDQINRLSYQDLKFYLQSNMLFKIDRASMMASLEVRAPFLDHRFVDFVFGLPGKWKLNGSTTKFLLKRIAHQFLPTDIVTRPKKGFGIPVTRWIRQDLHDRVDEKLSVQKLTRSGLFQPAYVRELLSRHWSGKADHRKLIWPLFMFQCWYDQIFENESM